MDKLSSIKDDLYLISDCKNVSVFSSGKNFDSEEWTRTLNSLSSSEDFIALISSEDLKTNVLSADKYKESLLRLKKNEEFLFEELTFRLDEYNFVKKDFVDEVGDYSVRGGIVDLFPEHYDSPVRIEFLGESVESIREFDITQPAFHERT
ncbi:MAG: hypothetical protein AB2L26_11315 [Ignavibacteria bacterium]